MAVWLNPLSELPFPQRRTSSRIRTMAAAVSISKNCKAQEHQRMKQLFQEARKRCILDPNDGVSFTLDEFHAALDRHSFAGLGDKVNGTIFLTNSDGAYVDIASVKSEAFLPLKEACIHKIDHVSVAGLYPGSDREFVVIGENVADGSLILSLGVIQCDLAWERCRQLMEEDVVVRGKVIGENKGGLIVVVEGLHGFVPFSQIPRKPNAGLLNKELLLKFVDVDKEQSQLILSNRRTVEGGHVQLGIGSVVIGNVDSVKPYGALIDIGGYIGLLHISQISHERISDIATVLKPGNTIKVMIMSHDCERERVNLTTKKLEPTPGDMIHNPKLVFEKAEEMAESFKQRIAHVEEMANVMLRGCQPAGIVYSLLDKKEEADDKFEIFGNVVPGEFSQRFH